MIGGFYTSAGRFNCRFADDVFDSSLTTLGNQDKILESDPEAFDGFGEINADGMSPLLR